MTYRNLIPFLLFAIVAAVLAVGLTLNPKEIPSALIGKAIPEFVLPPLDGRDRGLDSADLKSGEVQVVNIFSSSCIPCRAEHPFLMKLSQSGKVPLNGINYKDKPDKAKEWLRDMGDPFHRIGTDRDGRVSIDWGVYGVPETFIVDGEGRIRMKYVGPLNNQDRIAAFMACLDRVMNGNGACEG
jgi:cytochrome c biogenesis protein CcmG/thiol:disulfide interchange protein DsbE